MALNTINAFNEVSPIFEPLEVMDTGVDNADFKGDLVDAAFTSAKSKLDEFIQKITELATKMESIGTTGIRGTTISTGISTYKNNTNKVRDQIESKKAEGARLIEERLKRMDEGERKAGQETTMVDQFAQKGATVNDAIMDKANDIINWAQQGLQRTGAAVGSAVQYAGNVATGAAVTAGQHAISAGANAVGTGVNAVGNAINNVGTGIENTANNVGNFVSNTGDAIVNAGNAAYDFAGNVVDKTAQFVSNTGDALVNAGNAAYNYAGNFVSNAVDNIQNAGNTISNMGSNVMDWADSISNW